MFTKEINNFLRNTKRVYNLSFVETNYNYESKSYDTKEHLRLNLTTLRVYAAKGSGGNCVLFSDNRVLMEQLYHLCRLFNYDVHYDEIGRYRTLMLIGCDGSCSAMGNVSMFARVNDAIPDHLFDKDKDRD